MRKFYLENSIGERRELLSHTLFFSSPTGLGFSYDSEYSKTANGFFSRTKSDLQQIDIVGEIVFPQDCYAAYRSFVNWICAADDLKLCYIPYGTTEFFIDIMVDSIEKTEIGEGGVLVAPINFKGLSLWYKKNPMVFTFTEPPEDNYKKYDYKYDYVYPLSFASNSIDIFVGGHGSAAIKFEGNGVLTNPCLTLTDSSGAEIGKIDLNGTSITTGEKLIISTQPHSDGVWKIGTDGTKTDLIDLIDLSISDFFSIPAQTACTLTLSIDNAIETTSTVYIYEYYRSV